MDTSDLKIRRLEEGEWKFIRMLRARKYLDTQLLGDLFTATYYSSLRNAIKSFPHIASVKLTHLNDSHYAELRTQRGIGPKTIQMLREAVQDRIEENLEAIEEGRVLIPMFADCLNRCEATDAN